MELIAIIIATGIAFWILHNMSDIHTKPDDPVQATIELELYGVGAVVGMLGNTRIYQRLETKDGQQYDYYGLDKPGVVINLAPPYLRTNGLIYVPISVKNDK